MVIKMFQYDNDINQFANNYLDNFKNVKDKCILTEEIDSAYARANSIEKNRDMKNKNNISRKKAWIKIAKELQKLRDDLS